MGPYLLRRLLLLPITLFCIVLVNFVIVNLAPGDPTTVTEISAEGGAEREERMAYAFGGDFRYLQFREHYGLTLPILLNTWPWIGRQEVRGHLERLLDREGQSVKEYDALRVKTGDQARYTMRPLLAILSDPEESDPIRELAVRFFVRGGTRQAHVGARLTEVQKQENRAIEQSNTALQVALGVSLEEAKVRLNRWWEEWKPPHRSKWKVLFFETRFFRYFSRVLTLDFGAIRNDPNKSVFSEVTKRFKISLTLALLPLLITFALCLVFGFLMAWWQWSFFDRGLNFLFLVLFAIPVFVAAPFLIEKVALNGPFPLSGFHSPDAQYDQMGAWERLLDIGHHIALPLVAILYSSLATQSRLARAAVLDVMRQDYVRTARAKGLPTSQILFKHIGRNSAIVMVTAIASSLGVVLGGSLIVETLFEIDGFGKFFYDAIVNRDYNVIMFSALAGAFLSLIGYLAADISYAALDPRVSLD